jgi:hypothetical protein
MALGATNVASVTIAAGQSISSSADLTASELAMILAPPNLDVGAAGRLNLSFLISADNSVFFDLLDQHAAEILQTVVPDCAVNVAPTATQAHMYLKIRSGSRATPVVQSADRVFTLLLIPT